MLTSSQHQSELDVLSTITLKIREGVEGGGKVGINGERGRGGRKGEGREKGGRRGEGKWGKKGSWIEGREYVRKYVHIHRININTSC